MASRNLTPGSYIVLAGLLLLALIVAVVSFIIPFNLYPAVHSEEKQGSEEEALAANIDLMYTPEASTSSDAARKFQEKILASYGTTPTEAGAGSSDNEASSSSGNSSEGSGKDALTIISGAGCLACHQAGDQGVAAIGPSLNGIADRVAGYNVDLSPEEYIRESIVNPAAFLSPECPPNGDPCLNVMPATFGDTLRESDIDAIVSYLVTLPAE